MRDVLKQMRPDRLEDLIAAVALYRPGPMANIPAYCARKQGEPWEPPHPAIADILGETYGIMVYQEQVMQIAQKMAGYSLGGADLLRRAMGKKIAAEMEQQRKIFTDGATERGVTPEKATEVFDLMAKFADYGFNKSHAAAYALVAYHTAYMKANHPEAFLAGCMSLALSNTDKLAALRQEASRMGIKVLPPDINRSGADFTLEPDNDGKLCIRYALAAVKKVGQAAMEALVRTRGAKQFADVSDFAARVDPKQLNKMQIENLARAGAFDSLDRNRGRMFASAETILRSAQAAAEEKTSGQVALFGGAEPEKLRLPNIADWEEMDRLGYEADAIGFHLTAHPLDAYASVLRRIGAVASNRLEDRAQLGAARVKLAGCVINSKERITAKGSRMAWVRLSDGGGSYEVTFFSEVLSRSREMLQAGNAILVTADLKLEGDSLRITAQECEPLDQAATRAGAGIRIWLQQTEAVAHIRALLEREGKGRGRVVLVPQIGETKEVEIPLPGGFNVSARLSQALKSMPGVERVEEL
jgi:DNA polymerase-3 subunit alpha